jgi:putative ABC transport system ATP-binding protein
MQALTGSPELVARPRVPLVQIEHLSRVISTKDPPVVILDDLTFNIYNPGLFAGEELQAKSEDALARWRGRHLGIIFQFFQLIPTLTALENILLALELGASLSRKEWVQRAQACLQSVGMQGLSGRLPGELSGGQQQRVAIARALANDPPMLIADEPTGNLDSRTAGQIFAILAHLARQGKTVVFVTHDPQLASQADGRIDLLDGRMVAVETQFLREDAPQTDAPEGSQVLKTEGQA